MKTDFNSQFLDISPDAAMTMAPVGKVPGHDGPKDKLPMNAPARSSHSPLWPLTVFLLFTVAVVWGGYAFFERLKQEEKATAASTLTSVGKLKAEQIRSYLDQNQKFALSVARLLGQGELANWLRDGAPVMPEALRESLLTVLRNRGENALLILAPDASVRFSAGQFTQLTEEGRRFALRAMTEPPPVNSDIYRGDPSAPEQALLDIFVPIQSTDGDRAVGVLVLRNDLAYLYDLIQTWPVESPTAESVLVRLEGDHALFLNELRFRKQTALRMQVPLSASQNFPGWPSTAALKGQVGIWEARDYRNHAVLACTLQVAGPVPGWGMVVKMDLAEVFAPVQRLKNVTVGVTAAFILFALLALESWLWLLRGKNDREIAERQRIRQHNEQLEQRVRARTAELEASIKEIGDLRAALDEHALVAITDPQGKISYVNDRFCAISRYTREELLGQDHRIINSGHHSKAFFSQLWQTIGGGRIWKGEIKNRTKDGMDYWVDTTLVPFLDADGKPSQYIAIRTDITEHKQAEERIKQLNADLQSRAAELEAANKELESFSYSVSHDLRAPLRGIAGFAEALARGYRTRLDAEGGKYLDRVLAATDRMGQLIDDLLDLSRVTRADFSRRTVDLSAMARSIAENLQQAAPHRQAEFLIADGIKVEGDSRLLHVVLENLLGNAWKFTSKKPSTRIEFGTTPGSDGRNICYVRDNGAGFDMNYATKLFGPFQRLHSLSDFPGTGIGLATVQRIIQRHGGQVWAVAKIDAGATFSFSL